ncbi:TIGR03086 family metal-binding protein [Streptomyces sp. CA-250714]|uniref:TIGR03086 family metal-binding protein n=1 Tax=Streptomyces sp. CA-250714 TaxID=3240060 RepID=UPI003D94A0F8
MSATTMSATTTPGTADRYARLADAFLARVRATPTDRWDAGSPCQGWTARDVVAHVINGHRGILAAIHGTPPSPAHGVAVSPMAEAPAVEPGADLAAAFLACRADVLAALRDPALAARPLPGGPLGPVPLEQAVDVIGALELLGHTWDLARATGGDEILDQDAVARTHQALLPLHAELLDTGAFDASVPAPDGADAQTAFLCFIGRRP